MAAGGCGSGGEGEGVQRERERISISRHIIWTKVFLGAKGTTLHPRRLGRVFRMSLMHTSGLGPM